MLRAARTPGPGARLVDAILESGDQLTRVPACHGNFDDLRDAGDRWAHVRDGVKLPPRDEREASLW